MVRSSISVEALRGALATLPAERQRVYILIAREGLGYAAVAETMGVSVGTVERLLAEALVDLMSALDRA